MSEILLAVTKRFEELEKKERYLDFVIKAQAILPNHNS